MNRRLFRPRNAAPAANRRAVALTVVGLIVASLVGAARPIAEAGVARAKKDVDAKKWAKITCGSARDFLDASYEAVAPAFADTTGAAIRTAIDAIEAAHAALSKRANRAGPPPVKGGAAAFAPFTRALGNADGALRRIARDQASVADQPAALVDFMQAQVVRGIIVPLWNAYWGVWDTSAGERLTSDSAFTTCSENAPFELATPAFADGRPIPRHFACARVSGGERVPAFVWTPPPAGTQQLALVLVDRFFATRSDLAELGGSPHDLIVTIGADVVTLSDWSRSAGRSLNPNVGASWPGPCPPSGENHEYQFTLYALRAPVDVPSGTLTVTDITRVLRQLKANAVAQTILTGFCCP